MSFFEAGEDSEDERLSKQHSRLNDIIGSRDPEVKHGREAELGELTGEGQLLTEDEELEKLRKSCRYDEYAAKKRAHQKIDSKNSLSVLDDENPSTECSGRNPLPYKTHRSTGEEPSHTEGHCNPVNDDEPQEDQDVRVRKRQRTVKRIDPKIVDDSSSEDESESDDEAPIGPSLPFSTSPTEPQVNIFNHIPIRMKQKLGSSHNSYVTGIAIDNAGNRLVSVSLDATAMMWDFNSMSSAMLPFRTFKPLADSPLRTIEYSRTGGFLLCSGRARTAVMMDREGNVLSQTTQGDMYIVDSARTKGHTASILAAKWYPHQGSDLSRMITSAGDGTIRVWDINNTVRVPMSKIPAMTQLMVKKLRNRHGGRISATAFDWWDDGHSGAFGCSDGTLKVLDVRSSSMRPASESAPDVSKGEEITSVCNASSTCAQPVVLVRSSDDCLRVYDTRNLRKPTGVFRGLPNSISETNVCFVGQTGEYFATGTSATRKRGSSGSLRIFSRRDMREVLCLETDQELGSCITVLWKDSLNQIIVGTGCGDLLAFYDPNHSERGVLNCLTKKSERKVQGVASVGVGVVVPGSSVFLGKERISGNISSVHHGPLTIRGPSSSPSTKPNTALPLRRTPKKSATLAQHLSKHDISSEWAKDPREALLQYADVAAKDPRFTKIYQKTQPATQLTDKTAEEEEEESRKAIYGRDRLRNLQKEPDSNPR